MAQAKLSSQEIEQHLKNQMTAAAAAGSSLKVVLQDDPDGDYTLEKVERQGASGAMLRYRCGETGGMYAAAVSGDPDGEGLVRLTPEGLKGRDEDGEFIEVRRSRGRLA